MTNQKDIIRFLVAFDEKTGQLDTLGLIHSALHFLSDELKLYRHSVAMLPAGKKRFEIFDTSNELNKIEALKVIPFTDVHLSSIVINKKPLYRRDIHHSKPRFQFDRILIKAGLKSDFNIPLIAGGNCIGTLSTGSNKIDGISENDRQLLLLVAPKLTQSLRNAMLHEELQKSNDKYKNLLDTMDDLVFVLDADNRFTSYFGPVEKLLLNPKNFIGKKHEQVMPAEIDQMFQSAMKGVKHGKNAEYSYSMNVLGKALWYAIKLSPLMEDGKYNGLIAVARNITAQKKQEAALVEAEEKLRLITENTSDNIAILTFDLKAIYTYVNPSVKYVLGFEPEDLVGKSVFDFIHPDDKKALLPLLKKYISQKVQKFFWKKEIPPSETIEFRFIDKAGKWRNMQSTVNIAGKRLLAVTRDITAQKQAEDALLESKERYRGLSEAAFESIFISEKGLCIEQNSTAEKMFGHTLSEAIGRMGTEWIAPEDRDLVMKNMISGYEKPYQATALRKDGSSFPCEIQGKMMHYKGRDVRVTALRDITYWKQVEKALTNSEKLYRNLIDALPQFIYHLDNKLRYIAANKAYCERYSIPQNDIAGKTSADFFPRPIADKYTASDRKIIETAKAVEYVEKSKISTKEDKWVQVIKVPSFDKKGAIDGMIGIFWDITQRKQAGELLLENLERQNLVLNSLPIVFYTTTTDKTMGNTWLSEQVKNITGFTAKEMMSDSRFWENRIHPDDKKKALKEYYCIFDTNIVETEYRWKTASGPYKWFQDKAILLTDENNNPKQIIGLWIDITEKVEAENKLRQSEAQLKEAQHLVQLGSWELDYTTDKLNWSEEVFRIFELDPGHFKPDNKAPLNIIHPDDQDFVNKAFIESIKNHVPNDIVHRLQMNDGRIKFVHERCKTQYDDAGNPIRSLGTIQDITEQKKAEDELKKHREHLEELVKERTAELELKNAELERFNKLFVGREFRIKELRDKVKILEGKLKPPG